MQSATSLGSCKHVAYNDVPNTHVGVQLAAMSCLHADRLHASNEDRFVDCRFPLPARALPALSWRPEPAEGSTLDRGSEPLASVADRSAWC